MSSAGMSHKWVWLLLVASLAFNAGVGTTSGVRAYNKYYGPCDRGGDGRPCRGQRGCGMLEKLNLTPEQHAQVEAARDRMMEQGHELRSGARNEIEVLIGLMAVGEPDREAIAAQVGKIARARERLDHHMVEHFLDTRQLLEPAQYEAFDEMIRHALSRGGRGHGGFGGPDGLHKGPGRGRRGPSQKGNH